MIARRLGFIALALLAPRAFAQGQPKDEAVRHFRIGLELVDRSAWDSALAEFLRARELYPSATALRNAAVCLRELGRFDEALDMYDDLLAHLASDLSPTERAQVDADVARLGRFVGSLDVNSDPPGANVLVDGHTRGTTPLAHPLRVTVGTRTIHVDKEAYATFESRTLVASGETTHVSAKLVIVSRLGKLRVGGPAGFDVVVDGAVVGVTPWEGTLTVGAHFVSVRNAQDDGSTPEMIEVRTGQPQGVVPNVMKLSGRLRVEPTPNDASVLVDGVLATRGSLNAQVASGRHVITVSAPWYQPEAQAVHVSSRTAQALRPVLLAVPRAYVDISAGVVPLFDSTAHLGLGLGCTQQCVGLSTTLRGGYNVTPHVAFEAGILWFQLTEQASGTLAGTTSSGTQVVASYTENASATVIAGVASVRYQAFPRTPFSLRLSAGLARTFSNAASAGSYFVGSEYRPFGHDPYSIASWGAVLLPEVRFGYRFSSGLTIDAGIGLLITNFPSVPAETAQLAPNGLDTTPPRPSYGGIAWAIPLTFAFRLEL